MHMWKNLVFLVSVMASLVILYWQENQASSRLFK